MKLSTSFIYASPEYTTFEKFVPSPYFRKSIVLDSVPEKCDITISALGFYRLWINGTEITKGLLAPYISNTDHIVYYDHYSIEKYLQQGNNCIGVQLGNGMQNCPGGFIWDFELARFRSAPKLSFCVEYGETSIEADETVKTAPSPIYFDDIRCGCRYDARNEINGWNLPDFDDRAWANAIVCSKPAGELRICEADPILPTGEELTAVDITKREAVPFDPDHRKIKLMKPQEKNEAAEYWVYDFGVNKTGHCRLKINGRPGQRIELQYAECLSKDGKLDYTNIHFYPDGYSQRDVYICKGGEEIFEPSFTYHGFQYCGVTGIDDDQATPELLTYVVTNSDLKRRGGFECSDKDANRLCEITSVSDLSNFFYFPTDCPHREKNGWTGDAAVSAEHMLMTLTPEKSFTEWLRNIRKAMKEDGQLPGIIPTGDWGYEWGNGPAWDRVLTYLPYYTYLYTGDRNILEENATAIFRYLNYISLNRTERGTVDFGLGDWCPVGRVVKPTVEFTSSLCCMSIAEKAEFIFGVLNMPLQKKFARSLHDEIKAAVRKHLVDLENLTADTGCQTAQAMALFHNLFEENEKQRAFRVLLDIIHDSYDHIDFGLLGSRVLFHVLSEYGESELAYNMICRRDWPSYGFFLTLGMNSLPEDFLDAIYSRKDSLNHHFMGDILNWFISGVAGLKYNPYRDDHKKVLIKPSFIEKLSFARAYFDSPYGRIETEWKREKADVIVSVGIPDNVFNCVIEAPEGWCFEDSTTHKTLTHSRSVKLIKNVMEIPNP